MSVRQTIGVKLAEFGQQALRDDAENKAHGYISPALALVAPMGRLAIWAGEGIMGKGMIEPPEPEEGPSV